jgi:hypothetical protein
MINLGHWGVVMSTQAFPAMAIGLAFALCGCATQAQRQYQAIKAGNETHVAELKACAANVYNSPDYALIRPHVPLLITDATSQQL